jgi:hypothetical protein
MWYINHSHYMANSNLMSQSRIKWTTKQHPLKLAEPYNTKRVDFVIFMWDSIFFSRFHFFLGDYFDRKNREMFQLPFSRMVGRPRSAGTTVKCRKT